MSTDITLFNFEGNNIRTVVVDGDPWFVGKDVAEVLGYRDTTNAMKLHCRGVAKHHPIIDNLGRTQEARIINEPDMLRLIVKSQLPSAIKFEAWVFEEVLPQIRKTGKYNIKPQFQLPSYPEALRQLATKIEENSLLQEKIEKDAPKVTLAEALLESDSGIRITDFARASSDTYGLGRNKMYAKLREWKILDYKNQPYQKCIDAGWFYTVERPFTNGDFSGINIQVFVTGKGQKYVVNRLFKEGILGKGCGNG